MKLFPQKKGQSALEYLMTYGWGLVVVGVVIAALVLLYVNPASTKQATSGFQGGGISLMNTKYPASASDTLQFIISNQTGRQVTLDSSAVVITNGGTPVGGTFTTTLGTPNPTVTLKPGVQTTITFTPAGSWSSGLLNLDVKITALDSDQFAKTSSGKISFTIIGGGNPPGQTCGNGIIEGTETCDQGGGNVANGDGCSSTCQIESGWNCTGQPSVCTPITCPNNICAAVENCPADSGYCTPTNGFNVCTNYSCTNGCQFTGFIDPNTPQFDFCDSTHNTYPCTGNNCVCDGSGHCIDQGRMYCSVPADCQPHVVCQSESCQSNECLSMMITNETDAGYCDQSHSSGSCSSPPCFCQTGNCTPGTLITSCNQILTTPGNYYLTGDITTGLGNCITIQGSEITLDCQHHTIAASTGILVNGSSNDTIQNCLITASNTGINVTGAASNITIQNNKSITEYEGIKLTVTGGTGIHLGSQTRNITIQNNVIKTSAKLNAATGILVDDGSANNSIGTTNGQNGNDLCLFNYFFGYKIQILGLSSQRGYTNNWCPSTGYSGPPSVACNNVTCHS